MANRRRLASHVALAALGLGACGGAEEGTSTSTSSTASSATTSRAPASSAATTAPTTTAAAPTTAGVAPGARVVAVTVREGSVEGGARRESVDLGDQVRLQVTSDVADEVHVHGYDLRADVPAGGSVDVEFAADLPGVWEVELEGRGLTLVELAVNP